MSPVTVTLTFPSFEDTIIALSKLRAEAPKAETVKPAPDPKAETKKTDAPKAETKKTDAPKTETKKADPESTGLVYETDVAPKIAAAVKTNRADVIEVLRRFDAKTGKDLKAADYAAFLEDLQTRIEASANLA